MTSAHVRACYFIYRVFELQQSYTNPTVSSNMHPGKQADAVSILHRHAWRGPGFR